MQSFVSFTLAGYCPNLNAATTNAIDAHLVEIASVRNPNSADNGTVLAVVTFPEDKKKSNLACDGEPWHDVRLRMDYERLIGLNSKKINDMFSPRAQSRFRRRLGLEHQLPPGIEYVLDFTPPSEGPELADLTAALWLPRMVKLWFLAGQYIPDPVLANGHGVPTRPLADKAVGAILALGHDDVCKGIACLTDFAEWQTKEGLPGIVEDAPSSSLGSANTVPSWRKVEDYCPIRHRVAIVRLLKAINGAGLLLNSAVRMWTIAQVAISLEVPQVVVDPVTQWLVAPPNTKFIEICPERAFQLAYALKIPSVLIAAFKILVNELAIDYASSNPLPGRSPLTWTQRRRDDYGDFPSDPIEYASRAFAERMNGKFKMLQSDDVFNLLPSRIREWDKLQYYGTLIDAASDSNSDDRSIFHSLVSPLTTGNLKLAYDNLTAALLFTFRLWISKALEVGPLYNPQLSANRLEDLIDAQRRHYISDADRKPLLSLYWTLNPAQKVLTPLFWDSLSWTQPYYDFGATVCNGYPLSRHVMNFNIELRRAIRDGTIVPDLSHPTLTELASFLDDKKMVFLLEEFHNQLARATKEFCARDLLGRAADSNSGIPFFLSDHLLLSLDENELNYLPIWADGLDDGSGGVYQDPIPPADMGPSEPGPGYHTGWTVPGTETETDGRTMTGYGGDGRDGGESTAPPPSDLGVGALSLGTGTTGTAGRSLHVQESRAAPTASTSVTQGRSMVTPSEAFTADVDDDGAYVDARFAQPAAHQAQGQAIERYVDEPEEEGEGSTSGAGAGGGDGMMDLDSDEEIDFGSDDGSSTLDGFEEVDIEEAR